MSVDGAAHALDLTGTSGNDSAAAAGFLPLGSHSELRAMNRASPRDLELISTSGHGWARAAGFRNLDPSNESASGNESAHAAGLLPLDRSVR